MKKFIFTFYIRTKQGQEFTVGSKTIEAKDYDTANTILTKQSMNLPFHHFATVKSM